MLENLESKILRVGRAIYRLPRLERIDGCDAVGLVRLKLFRRVLGGRPQRLRLAFQSRQAACRHHGEADFHLVLRRVHETPQSAQRAKLWLERSEEHTSELQSLMRISYAVLSLKKKKTSQNKNNQIITNVVS